MMKVPEFLANVCRMLPRTATTITIGAAALVTACSPDVNNWLQFDRTAIASGELWRFVTCHLTHWNVEHLQWDLLMFVVLGAVCELRDPRRMQLCVAASALVVAAIVFKFFPSIHFYRGLSGIDTGLFVLLAISLLQDARADGNHRLAILAVGLLLGLAFKLGYEGATGATFFVNQQEAGFTSLVWDHAAGAIVGATVALCRWPDWARDYSVAGAA